MILWTGLASGTMSAVVVCCPLSAVSCHGGCGAATRSCGVTGRSMRGPLEPGVGCRTRRTAQNLTMIASMSDGVAQAEMLAR